VIRVANLLDQFKALSTTLQRQLAYALLKTGFFATRTERYTGTEVHGNEAHSPDFASDTDLSTHTGAASPHSAHATLVGGKVPVTELGSGTANDTTYLRGDQTYGVPVGAGMAVHNNDYHDPDYVAVNAAITGATKTKITYDAKGLVTSGADATFDDIGDGTTNKAYTATEKSKLAGIAGDANKKTITQAGHSFVAGNPLYRKSDSTYALAKADVETTAEVVGIVESVAGDDFVLVMGGWITGLSGGTDGSVGFLSAATAGAITTTEPDPALYISKPIIVYTGTTTGIVLNMRGLTQSAVSAASVVDVVGGRLEYVSTTSMKYGFLHNNQFISHNGTDLRLVKLAAEPTLSSTANDIAGVAQTYDIIYDVFALDDSDTAFSLIGRKWAVSTAGSSSRTAVWVTSTAYKKGDVRSNGTPAHYYLCKHDHTSGASTEPGVGASWADEWTDLGVANGSNVGEGLYRQDGIWVLGPNDIGTNPIDGRRYRWLGTFRCINSSGAKFAMGSQQCFISNFYNQDAWPLAKVGGTNTVEVITWTSPQSWDANGDAFKLEFVCSKPMTVVFIASAVPEAPNVTSDICPVIGIGINAKTLAAESSTGVVLVYTATAIAGFKAPANCVARKRFSAGYHIAYPLVWAYGSAVGAINYNRLGIVASFSTEVKN